MRARTVMVTVVMGALAGCGGGDGGTASAPTVSRDSLEAAPAIDAGAMDPEAVAGAPDAVAGGSDTASGEPGAGATESTAPPFGENLATEPGRQVILTGSIDLGVDEVAPAVAKVVVLVEGLGGVVAGEQSDYADERATSVLTVKVPPEQFRPALNALSRLGEVSAQNVGSEDVTATVVDLESRITTASISVERLRGYLAEATTTADVAALEGELMRRESDLEAMRGQLRSLQDRVTLATIVVTVRRVDPDAPPPDDAAPGFSDAVEAGRRALVGAASGVALVIGAALPWVPLVLVLWLVVAVTRRMRRRARPAVPTAGTAQQDDEERQPEPVG